MSPWKAAVGIAFGREGWLDRVMCLLYYRQLRLVRVVGECKFSCYGLVCTVCKGTYASLLCFLSCSTSTVEFHSRSAVSSTSLTHAFNVVGCHVEGLLLWIMGQRDPLLQ